MLLKAYPSLDSLKKATKEELMQLVPEDIASKIREYIEKEKNK